MHVFLCVPVDSDDDKEEDRRCGDETVEELEHNVDDHEDSVVETQYGRLWRWHT